jgi:hypothetical protein
MVEHDGEVEAGSEIEIKEEPQSDEDDDYQLRIEEGDHEDGDIDNNAHGQTSLDLATDKKDVSLILEDIFHCCVFCSGRPKDYRSQVYGILKCNFITDLTNSLLWSYSKVVEALLHTSPCLFIHM